MIYYVIAALAPLVAWYVGELIKKTNRKTNVERDLKWLLYLGVLPMFLLYVLRASNVGGDTPGYVRMFQDILPDVDFVDLFTSKQTKGEEYGYLVYAKVISLFTNDYTIYFLINGLVVFGSLMHFAKRYTKNPLIFFFLFVTLGTYSFVLTGLRQSLAIAVCLWAVDMVKKKKFLRFLLMVYLASLFHKSAIVFIAIYPFSKLKRTDAIATAYVIVGTVLFLGFAFFQDLFNQLLGYDYAVEATGNGEIFLVLIAMMFVFSVYTLQEHTPGKSENNLVFHLGALTVLLWVLRMVSRTAERISYYFITGFYAYFASACAYQRDKTIGVIKWLIIIASLALFVYRNLGAYYAFVF